MRALTPGGEEPFGVDAYTAFSDVLFRYKKKHNLVEVPPPTPALEAPLADTHIHLAMLRNPALALARAAVHGVGFVCCISDPSSDADVVYSQVDSWIADAKNLLGSLTDAECSPPLVRIACGCHPHEARHYTPALESELRTFLKDARTCCLGEIGLDYHYDFSPRAVQRDVFRRQLALAHETGLPVSLHLREAHEDALAIMDEEGFPEAGTILHCFNLGASVLQPWVSRGCYVAVGGALTFASSDDLRAALPYVPSGKLLLETDGPYMAPKPFRGCECTSDHLVFTAAAVAQQLELETGENRKAFFTAMYEQSLALLNRGNTQWQNE